MLKEDGIYLVCDGMGEVMVARRWGNSFEFFGSDESLPYYPDPNDLPEFAKKFPTTYIALVIREIVVEELNV